MAWSDYFFGPGAGDMGASANRYGGITGPAGGSSSGGWAPYALMALQALSGGLAGAGAATQAGARNFGAGIGPGVVGGMQATGQNLKTSMDLQEARRRNRLADAQTSYMGLEGQDLQSKISLRNQSLAAAQAAANYVNNGTSLQAPATEGTAAAPAAGGGVATTQQAGLAPGGSGATPAPVPEKKYQRMLNAAAYVAASNPELAKSYTDMVEKDTQYQADKAAGLIPGEVAKAIAISNGTLGNEIAIHAAGKPITSVSQYTESERNKGYGQLQVKEIAGWRDNADKAVAIVKTASRIQGLINDGLQTGAGTGFKAQVGNWLSSSGLVSADTANRVFQTQGTAQFNAAKNKMVVDMLGGLGKQISDNDRVYMDTTLGTINDPTQAIVSILNYVNSQAQLDIGKYDQGMKDFQAGGDPLQFGLRWDKQYGVGGQYGTPSPAAPGASPAAPPAAAGGRRSVDDLVKQYGPRTTP